MIRRKICHRLPRHLAPHAAHNQTKQTTANAALPDFTMFTAAKRIARIAANVPASWHSPTAARGHVRAFSGTVQTARPA